MTDWKSVNDEMPEVGQRVEFFFAPKPDFIIEDTGIFQGYYVDEDGKEWRDMHIFTGDSGGWLTGDVTHWKPLQQKEKGNSVDA